MWTAFSLFLLLLLRYKGDDVYQRQLYRSNTIACFTDLILIWHERRKKMFSSFHFYEKKHSHFVHTRKVSNNTKQISAVSQPNIHLAPDEHFVAVIFFF